MFDSLKSFFSNKQVSKFPLEKQTPQELPKLEEKPRVDKSQPYEGLYNLQSPKEEDNTTQSPRKFKVLLNLRDK